MAKRQNKTVTDGENLSLFAFMKAKRWPIVLLVMVLVIAVGTVGVSFAFNRVMDQSILVDSSGNTEDDDGVLDDEIATKPEEKAQYMNVLLCGIDYKENTKRAKLTDVMMVIHMDFVEGKVDILQLPRDTYIGRDYSTGKLNAIYGSKNNGGIENLARKINSMLQIPLDYYVQVDMDGFEDIVDAIGGVTVDSPYSFTLEGVTIVKGVQTLDGHAANKFVRERHAYAAGDLTRMKMQQIFLKAFVKKCLSLGKSEMLKLAPKVFEYLTTDMTLNQALSLYQSFSGMGLEDMQFHSCEVSNFMDGYDNLSKLSIHVKPLADILNTHFRENGEKVNWTELQIIEAATRYSYEGEQDQYEREPNSPYVYVPPRRPKPESSEETSSDVSSEETDVSSEISDVTSDPSSETTSDISSEGSSDVVSDTSSETSSAVSSETSSAVSSSSESVSSETTSSEAPVIDDPEAVPQDTSAFE